MTFCTCYFITDRSIVSYHEIFWSIAVKDKLATPGLSHNSNPQHVVSLSIVLVT